MRPVTEQRKVDADLVGEGCRCEGCIDADAQNLDTGLRELVPKVAKARELVRSAAGKGQRIESKD